MIPGTIEESHESLILSHPGGTTSRVLENVVNCQIAAKLEFLVSVWEFCSCFQEDSEIYKN